MAIRRLPHSRARLGRHSPDSHTGSTTEIVRRDPFHSLHELTDLLQVCPEQREFRLQEIVDVPVIDLVPVSVRQDIAESGRSGHPFGDFLVDDRPRSELPGHLSVGFGNVAALAPSLNQAWGDWSIKRVLLIDEERTLQFSVHRPRCFSITRRITRYERGDADHREGTGDHPEVPP